MRSISGRVYFLSFCSNVSSDNPASRSLWTLLRLIFLSELSLLLRVVTFPIKREILLAGREESIFFHELARAAYGLVTQSRGQSQAPAPAEKWQSEIVAELSNAALCRIVLNTWKYLGSQYQYIRHYAVEAKISPARACRTVLKDVEEVLRFILEPCPDPRRTSNHSASVKHHRS